MGYKNLKDGVAPGCDGLTAEMIKLRVEEGIDVYHHLCREVWHTGKWPLIGREQCLSLCQKRRSERVRKLSDNILNEPCEQNTFKDPTKEN